MNSFDTVIKQFDKNPWLLAIALVASNIGVGFITDDLTKKQKDILNNCILRKIYLFALLYCGTKNMYISLVSTLVYAIILHGLRLIEKNEF